VTTRSDDTKGRRGRASVGCESILGARLDTLLGAVEAPNCQ